MRVGYDSTWDEQSPLCELDPKAAKRLKLFQKAGPHGEDVLPFFFLPSSRHHISAPAEKGPRSVFNFNIWKELRINHLTFGTVQPLAAYPV